MNRLFIIVVLAAMSGLAHAQGASLHARTAGELAELCAQKGKDRVGAAKLNFCLGYAQGTFDSEEKHAADKKLFCLTSPAPTRAATMAEFARWVRSSGSTGTPSQEALLQFMDQKYPCK